MFFDILLLSVIVVTVYLGPMLLRRGGPEQRTYGWMLIGCGGLAVVAMAADRRPGHEDLADLLGFVAIGAAVFLVMIPPVLRDLSYRAYRGDRLRLAAFLAGVRDLLQPGMGAGQEKELIESNLAVREGRVEEAVDALRERRAEADDPLVRRRIDERIVLTYLYARQWAAAIDAYEKTIAQHVAPASPQTVAEMVWAYCEAGEIEKAAELVESLEASPLAREPIFSVLLNRARLVFLAFVGRTQAVEAIVSPDGSLGAVMTDAVRFFWAGVARLNAGDRPGARKSLGEAAKRSGRNQRVRELAEHRLSVVDQPGVAGPHAFPAPVAELADRLATVAAEPLDQPQAAPGSRIGRRGAPASLAIIVANVAVAGAVWALYGSTDAIGALVRGGNLRTGVELGEWWRLVSSTFLHVGLLHLFLNMYGLWVLGKFVEQIFGSTRFFAIYLAAGVVGMVASHLFSGAGTSAGASGAVFGLMGALLAELGVHREHYPKRWRSGLFRVLLLLTAVQVAIGFAYPAIDQAAHLGGLVAGAAMAAALSPRLSLAASPVMRTLASAVAGACLLAVAYGAFGAITTSYPETLAKAPARDVTLGALEVTAPGTWEQLDELYVGDSAGLLQIGLESKPAGSLDAHLSSLLDSVRDPSRARAEGFSRLRPVEGTSLRVPEPWISRELRAAVSTPTGESYLRVVVIGRDAPGGDGVWLGKITFPEGMADELAPVVTSVLDTVRRAKLPAAVEQAP